MTAQKDDWSEPIVWEDLTPREAPVKIAKEDYVLVEATAAEAKAWRANFMQSIRMRDTGGKKRESTSTFDARIADSHVILVSICLRKIELDGTRSRVPMDKISGWPNPLVETLFKRAELLSNLQDEEADEDHEKNGCGVTSPDTSADTP